MTKHVSLLQSKHKKKRQDPLISKSSSVLQNQVISIG